MKVKENTLYRSREGVVVYVEENTWREELQYMYYTIRADNGKRYSYCDENGEHWNDKHTLVEEIGDVSE